MGTPRISVIIPVKARIEQDVMWLEEAIKSVEAQTYKDWEAVICNDRSSVSLMPLTKYVRQAKFRGTKSKRVGVANARNQAASITKGELILGLDHDDLLPPEALEHLIGAWDNGGSDAGIVYGNTILFGQDFQRLFKSPKYSFGGLLRNLMLPIGSLHRRADWERVGGWKPEMEDGLEDWEYWIALGEIGVCGYHVDRTTYKYRRHPDSRLSRMRSSPDAYSKAYQRMRELHQDTFNGNMPAGCCGGVGQQDAVLGFRATAQPQRLKQLRQPLAALQSSGLVQVIYNGGMEGGFGIIGSVSGHRYNILGTGRRLSLPDGREGVDPRDIPYMLRLNRGRDFEVEAS